MGFLGVEYGRHTCPRTNPLSTIRAVHIDHAPHAKSPGQSQLPVAVTKPRDMECAASEVRWRSVHQEGRTLGWCGVSSVKKCHCTFQRDCQPKPFCENAPMRYRCTTSSGWFVMRTAGNAYTAPAEVRTFLRQLAQREPTPWSPSCPGSSRFWSTRLQTACHGSGRCSATRRALLFLPLHLDRRSMATLKNAKHPRRKVACSMVIVVRRRMMEDCWRARY